MFVCCCFVCGGRSHPLACGSHPSPRLRIGRHTERHLSVQVTCANETAYYSSLVTFVASGSVDDYNETVQEQLMTSVAVLVGANATNIYINVTANVADGRRALSSASVTVQMEVRPEAMLSHSSR